MTCLLQSNKEVPSHRLHFCIHLFQTDREVVYAIVCDVSKPRGEPKQAIYLTKKKRKKKNIEVSSVTNT